METLKIKIVNTDGVFSTQHLEIAHNFEKAQTIQVKKETIVIVDYEKYKNGIIWDDFPDLEISTKNILKELHYYSMIRLSLKKILDSFRYLDYSDRYKINDLANHAVGIIDKMEMPKYLPKLKLNKENDLSNIRYTLMKEIAALLGNRATSQRAKAELVNDAVRHLDSDLKYLVLTLDNFDV